MEIIKRGEKRKKRLYFICNTCDTEFTDNWIKTGKSCPQIAEILSKVRGEDDEQQT